MNIKDALEGARRNQKDSQRYLYYKFAPMLMTIARRYNSSSFDAQDIVQESFVQIFQNLQNYDPSKGKFESWITTISIRTALKLSRKYKKNFDNLDKIESLPNIDESVIDKLSADELISVINRIPIQYREVFNLYVIDGYSHKEIAEKFGMKESTSRSKLLRARNIINESLVKNHLIQKAI